MIDSKQKNMLWYSVLGTLVIKIILAIRIPITSDEAYFTIWARYPDFGYYDHPPMVGWILHLLSYGSHSELMMRLPAILFPILVGIGIYYLLREHNEDKAVLVSSLFLISPLNVLNILVTTDTPLILFSFISVFLLYKAVLHKHYGFYFMSGMFLGMAFLSKYFAVLTGLSYLAYFIITRKEKKKTLGFVILIMALTPFVLVNIYWNYTHCWANIVFNLFNRNSKEEFSFIKILLFIVSQAYLITPPVLFFLYRQRKELLRKIVDEKLVLFTCAFAVPIILFGLLSFKKVIGLHWVLSFYPFLYVLLFSVFDEQQLLKSIRFMFFFSVAHLLLIGAVVSLPLQYAKNNKNYNMIVMGTKPHEVIPHLKPYAGAYHFATPSYSQSAVLSYHSGNYFSVFGSGSQHGRQDDLLTDYSKFNGANILVVTTSKPDEEHYAPFFESIEIKNFSVDEADFHLVLGSRFNYAVYRERVLKEIKDTYYTIPHFLPSSPQSCYFFGKYFSTHTD